LYFVVLQQYILLKIYQ